MQLIMSGVLNITQVCNVEESPIDSVLLNSIACGCQHQSVDNGSLRP